MNLFGKKKRQRGRRSSEDWRRRQDFPEIDDYEEEYYEDSEEEFYEDEEYSEEEEEYSGYEEYSEYEEDYSGEEEEYSDDMVYDEEVEGDTEYYEEEYYGDNTDYYETDAEDVEYDTDEEDEELYYVEDGEYEDDGEEDEERMTHYRKKRGVAGAVLAFKSLPLVDKVIAFTGAAVLIFAVITASIFMSARNEEKAVEAFADVGASLEGIKIIGESGLLAMSDAQAAKAAVLQSEEVTIPQKETGEGVQVTMKTTSIVKDLKIKFVNAETDKLVANVPFQVEVTIPKKGTETWSDDDKDGIIYKENITPGDYEIKMIPLTGEEYSTYKLDTSAHDVTVKANIAYEKVDVAEEIKTEAEVNAAIEDTAIEEVVEESRLTDTVPFVKSTQTDGGESTYQKIDKSTIKDPSATASIIGTDVYLMTESPSGNDPQGTLTIGSDSISLSVNESKNISITNTTGEAVTSSSSDGNIATATVSGDTATIKAGEKVGEATITFTAGGKTADCKVSVTGGSIVPTPEKPEISIEGIKTVAVGESIKLTLKTDRTDGTADWKIADAGIAEKTASDNTSVTIKGLKAGTTKVEVTYSGSGFTAQANCEIKVTEKTASITLNPSSIKVAVKKSGDIKVVTVPDTAKITGVTSENTKIATAAYKDKVVTVTGVAVGDTKITIKCDNGQEAQAAVKVINNAELDTSSLLLDKNGRQVYVYENGKYRKAVYADYFKFNEFYIEIKGILYTGWQTINGKTYYYLEDHRYVTGEQVIQGAKYTFASDGSLVTGSGTLGIDVSKWNGNINWNSVKASGVSYAIIRCGYRGSSTGALITDPKFAANISGANAAGIKTGIYFFTQAVNEKEAVEEASMVLSLVKKYKISYPIFLDVESSGGRADNIDKGTRTAVCKAFCATIQNSGYTAGVYANKTWLNSKIDTGALGAYKIWLAQYAAAPTYTGRYNLWQYSSKGSIPGISGNVDLNQSYLGY